MKFKRIGSIFSSQFREQSLTKTNLVLGEYNLNFVYQRFWVYDIKTNDQANLQFELRPLMYFNQPHSDGFSIVSPKRFLDRLKDVLRKYENHRQFSLYDKIDFFKRNLYTFQDLSSGKQYQITAKGTYQEIRGILTPEIRFFLLSRNAEEFDEDVVLLDRWGSAMGLFRLRSAHILDNEQQKNRILGYYLK